jgi:DNA replication and repair protein RecF
VKTDQNQTLALMHRITKTPPRKKHEGPVLPVVIFSPDDVQLSKGAPLGRRRFLDWLLASMDSRYLRMYRQYNRALLQRNQALKNARLWSTVSSFDPALSQAGLYLWQRRQEVIQQIFPEAQEIFSGLTGMMLGGYLKWGGSPEPITTPIAYQNALDQRQDEEQRRGATLTGPHRDDIIITINQTLALPFASQGQHRAIALSLKLASYHVLENETGLIPIILLDDVLSELDPAKRSRLLTFIADHQPQTIITDTEARSFEDLHPQVYQVQRGGFTRWPS